MTTDRFFKFKDYLLLYYQDHERSPEEVLAAEVLYTFVIDADKIRNDFNIEKRTGIKPGFYRSQYYKYKELSTPPLDQFLNDLEGKMCEFFCDALNIEHDEFIKRVKLLLPENLLK